MPRTWTVLIGTSALSFALATVPAAGAAPAAAAPAAGATAATAADDDIPWLEAVHTQAHQGVHGAVQSVDSFFGDRPFDASGGKATGFIRLGTQWEQRGGWRAVARFRLHARLPNLENRAYVFMGRDDRDEEATDQPGQFRRDDQLERRRPDEDQAFFVGLGYMLRDGLDFRLGIQGSLHPYVQTRYRHQWRLSQRSRVNFRESVFWSTREHFGSTTAGDYEFDLAHTLLLRWANVATISQRRDDFRWQSSVGLFKDLPHLRTIAAETLLKGRTRSPTIRDYGVRLTWRQPIYKNWMFARVTVGHFWPRERYERSHHPSWVVGLNAEMQF